MNEAYTKQTNQTWLNPAVVRRICLATACLGTVLLVAWVSGVIPGFNSPPRQNSIMVIKPYRHHGTWVFDDLRAGLVKEPFVAGVPEMIDFLVQDIPDSESGFRMLFSARPFPGYQQELSWIREESGGNFYRLEEPPMEGWICPALFQYFEKAPAKLFVKAEPLGK